jgi:4-hydroxy-2-oxoheptanedioate aldolase
VKNNKAKQRIRSGKPVFGCWIKSGSAAAVEVAGKIGFDFVLLDTEHGALDSLTVENLIRAADVTGVSPIVRVGENLPIHILRNLDSGAHGVFIPQVESRDDAERAVRAARYAPDGERGSAFSQRCADWGFADPATYYASENEATMVVANIESAAGVDNIDAIASVRGLDVLNIGPADLAQSMGLVGQGNHPSVQAAINKIIEAGKKAGVAVGIGAKDAASAQKRIGQGVLFINFRSELMMFGERGRELLGGFGR